MGKVMTTADAVQQLRRRRRFPLHRRLYLQAALCGHPRNHHGRKSSDLTITRSNAADDFDMLIGAGCVKRFISTFISLGLYGLARCYRRSIEKGIPHKIELEEYTNLSLPLMLMAGAMGMPFVPVKDMVGTDLMNIKSFMGDEQVQDDRFPL